MAWAEEELAAQVPLEEPGLVAERDRAVEDLDLVEGPEPVVAWAGGEAMRTRPENGGLPRQCCGTRWQAGLEVYLQESLAELEKVAVGASP